jgi:hypothetical protein
MTGSDVKDLIILVADADMAQAVGGLLARPAALGIREGVTFKVVKHPRRDPGVFHEAPEFLRGLQGLYQYALVLLDREGCGQEDRRPQDIEEDIQRRLDSAGWKGRSAVVVLDPELEVWVFSASPHVIEVIAKGDRSLYDRVLDNCSKSSHGKPARPKEVMEEICRKKGVRRSASLYGELAQRVSLTGCSDRAFHKFREVLQQWFPRGQP